MRRTFLVIIALFVISIPFTGFAATEMTDLRDGQITFEVPDDWSTNDKSTKIRSDEGNRFYRIGELENDDYLISMSYVVSDLYESDETRTVKQTKKIYSKCGEELIMSYFEDYHSLEIGKPSYFKGETYPFARVRVDDLDNEYSYLVYIAYVAPGTFAIFECYEFGGADDIFKESVTKTLTGIIKSLDDNGYGYNLDVYEEESETPSFLIGAVVFIIFMIFVNRKTRNVDRKEERMYRRVFNHEDETDSDDGEVIVSREYTSAEESYVNSLKALVKSGLLTRKEYKEMIEKLNRRL